ncbi:MAG: DUF3783 domain-containing protein [Lachnospiraceae bacterium]|nr:DUF3783 domain-containing protein [Lachnospiraceae bacterium]
MGIVAFYVGQEKKEELQKLIAGLGLEAEELRPADLKKKVDEILEERGRGDELPPKSLLGEIFPTKAGDSGVPPLYRMPEVLLFCGVEDKALDAFLAGYKKAGLQPIADKAVITPTNRGWTLYQLLTEIRKEHDVMG